VGTDGCTLKIQTTNAQELYNHYQYFKNDQMLVLDFRSKKDFENWHLTGSINVPSDELRVSDLINFAEEKFIKKYWHTKHHQLVFKKRKRAMVIIIPFENPCDSLISQIPILFNKSKLEKLGDHTITQDFVSLRNSILFNKVLSSEKHRYSYLCKTSMKLISENYPFLWKFYGSACHLKPSSTGSLECTRFPSEIFEDCLYLGDCKAASDEKILQSLGITHILNVAKEIDNKFEDDSHFKIEYEKLDIEDMEDFPINSTFEHAYEYLDKVLFGAENTKKIQELDGEHLKKNRKTNLHSQDSDSVYLGELDTQVLKLDLGSGTIAEWCQDEVKKKAMEWDILVAEARKTQPHNKLMVHCAMGKSRSATIITMFIMKKFMLPFKIAATIVKERRETIDINYGFINQLWDFENSGFKFPAEFSDRCSESTEGEENNLLSGHC
jgi:Dual specificity phosphatase, catalytic domain